MRAKRPGSKPRPTFPNGKLGPDPRWYDAANIRPQIGNRQARSLGSKRWHEANPPVPIDHKYDDQVRRTRVRKIRKREGVCRECDRPSPGHTLCLVHRRLSCMRAQDARRSKTPRGGRVCVMRRAGGTGPRSLSGLWRGAAKDHVRQATESNPSRGGALSTVHRSARARAGVVCGVSLRSASRSESAQGALGGGGSLYEVRRGTRGHAPSLRPLQGAVIRLQETIPG